MNIIEDYSVSSFEPSVRKNINKCLILTGGGTNQTFFSMGAVKCLIDNNMFDFEVISGISGGTLLLTLIDLSICYKFNLENDWYNIYIRKPVYAFANSNPLCTFIKNGFDFAKFAPYIFSVMSDYAKTLDTTNIEIICEYNYIDASRLVISNDHTDVLDIEKGIKLPYWYFIRPFRCIFPFTILNGKPTYDAGAVANVPVNTIFTKYIPKQIFIILATPSLIYDKYPEKTYLDLITGAISNITASANHSLQDMIDLNIINCETKLYCSMSNSLYKSKDKYHKDLFTDYVQQISRLKRFYNGALYNDQNLIKIIENEGYIQMYYKLLETFPDKKLVFEIPNPDVYNDNVKNILNASIASDLGFEVFKSFVEAPFL